MLRSLCFQECRKVYRDIWSAGQIPCLPDVAVVPQTDGKGYSYRLVIGLFDTPVVCCLGLAYSNAHISLTAKRGLLLVWKEERIFTFAYLQVTGAEKTMGSGLSSS